MWHIKGMALKLQKLGKFYPNEGIDAELVEELPIEKFQVVEKVEKTEKKMVLGISDLQIFLWRREKTNKMVLEFCCNVQCVGEIYNSREKEVILKFKFYKNIRSFSSITKRLVFDSTTNEEQFTRKVLRTIPALQNVKIDY